MSDAKKSPPPALPQRGPFGMQMGPPSKPKSFGTALRRLIARVGPERKLVIAVIAFALVSVAMTITGPKILGGATKTVRGVFPARSRHNRTASRYLFGSSNSQYRISIPPSKAALS